MARDGAWVWSEPVRGRFVCETPLEAAVRPGLALCVRCPSCSVVARLDARPWIARGLGGLRLGRLEDKLRCLSCGARQVRFEVWSAADAPMSPRWSASGMG
jgi:hypothetical protein